MPSSAAVSPLDMPAARNTAVSEAMRMSACEAQAETATYRGTVDRGDDGLVHAPDCEDHIV